MSSPGPSLFVAYSGLSGGAGRFLVDVVSSLPRPVLIACPAGPLAEAARATGIAVIELPERPLELRGSAGTTVVALQALAAHARDIQRLVDDLQPVLLFTWGMRSAVAAAAVRRRPAWLARHHDLVPGPAVGALLRRALRSAGAVVVNSAAVARDLGLSRRVEVVWPGVDLQRFAPGPRAERRPAAAPPAVLWLGAIVGWKRPDLALEIARQSPELSLRMGGAPVDERGERLLRELRECAPANVELSGPLDAAEALSAADVLLHTADREPFGIVVAEALASGVPVVAPAAGGPAEILDDSCGRLFPPGDAAAAARGLREAIGKRDALGRGARRRAEELLDLERAREELRSLIEAHAAPHEPLPGNGVALVTVTHNSAAELAALLRSVAAHLPAARTVVVDSGSSDGSADVAREHGADVIELENVGYGAAANAGVATVDEPVTVVLNPDVELVDSSLARLAEAAAPDRIVVPSVLLPDGSRQDVAQPEPASAAFVAYALVPPALLPRPLRVALEPWRGRQPRRVGWAVGACIAGRTETLRRLGPFDPDAFLYAEDLDLGLRASDAGVQTWFWPAARVLHKRAHATRPAFGGEPFELLAQRRREVIETRRGRTRLRLDDLLQALTFADRIAIKTLLRRDSARERRQLEALRAARRKP